MYSSDAPLHQTINLCLIPNLRGSINLNLKSGSTNPLFPYHPQSDGMIERFNRTLLGMLSSGILEEDGNWEQILPAVMMAYRTSVHKTTHMSPFILVFGREVRLPVDIMFGNPPPELPKCSSMYALQLRNTLESAYHKVQAYLRVESRRQKEGYDRRVKGVGPSYKEGDFVWLHCPAVPRGKSRKLHRPWKGPFVVTKVLSDVVFRIQHRDPPRKRLVVHFNRLKPYLLSDIGKQEEPREQKNIEKNHSVPNEEERVLSSDSDADEGEVIIEVPGQAELEHQVPGQAELEHQVPGQAELEHQVPGQAELEHQAPGQAELEHQAPGQAELGDYEAEHNEDEPLGEPPRVLRRSTRIRRPPDRF